MTKASTNDGTDSALGFSFQGFYALLVLLDAADDDQISVETADDVVADGTNPRLIQLKHSIGNPSALNEKNDGLSARGGSRFAHGATSPGVSQPEVISAHG
jgi:hypothetical protein